MNNRKYLYRAKTKDGKRWVEGYYVYHEKRQICTVDDSVKEDEKVHLIFRDSFADWNMPRNLEGIEIDPETLCRYTERRDSNGREIWEHDIVRCYDGECFHGCWEFKADFDVSFDNAHSLLALEECCFKEVVGNVFDNPELLRGVSQL